jgi:hypothetical protein
VVGIDVGAEREVEPQKLAPSGRHDER